MSLAAQLEPMANVHKIERLEQERDQARAELAELKARYDKDVAELNQRLIDRREAYEAYCQRMKGT
jgi:hypothetical protein